MNKRASEILLLLIESSSNQNIKNLSNKYKVSKRTIYNDLEEIEDFLVQNNYHGFKKSGGENYIDITKFEENRLQKLTEAVKLQITESKQYAPDTRINYSIFLILKSGTTTTKELANELGLSISTIKNDLNVIKNKILPFNLELVTERFIGISIIGKEIDKRDLLIEIILDSYKINKFEEIDNFYMNYFKQKTLLNEAKMIIDNVADELEIQYVDKHYMFVWMSTFISLKRIIEGKTIKNDNHDDLTVNNHSSIFKVVRECILFTYRKHETMHLSQRTFDPDVSYIVSKIQVASYHGTADAVYDNWLDLQFIVNRLVKNIENQTDMIDSNDNRLHQEIIQHLRPAIKRLEKKISFENPLKDEIYKKYSELYIITKNNISIIEHFFEIKFTEDELSYIVLLFASSYERNKKTFEISPSVVIVCKEGISTSSILKSQLEQQFDINVLATYSKSKFSENMNKSKEINFDFVISTVSLDLDKNLYLKVNPILDEKDIMQLNTLFSLYKPEKSIAQIINKISPYVEIIEEESLKKALSEVMGINDDISHKNKRGVLMLKDVINEDLIATQQKADTAFDAVDLAGGLLKKSSLIDDNYISAMKDNLKENGPYFVIAPGVAMPHARPEEGSKGVGISIVTLESPIEFGHLTNDPVSLIIGLCAIDHQTHLNALAELMEILSDDEKLSKIINSENKIELLNILRGE